MRGPWWLFLCALVLFPGSVAGNWLTQNPASLSAKEGERVEIMCGYSTTYSSFALDWFQELPGKPPMFLLRRYSSSSEYKPSSVSSRFSSQLDAGAKSFTLSIDGAQLADSAVYFCALRETTALQTALGPYTKCQRRREWLTCGETSHVFSQCKWHMELI